MQTLLKILLTGLLLVLLVALGTEVVALHRSALSDQPPPQPAVPVVVRKAACASDFPKTVRPVSGQPFAHIITHKKSPAE